MNVTAWRSVHDKTGVATLLEARCCGVIQKESLCADWRHTFPDECDHAALVRAVSSQVLSRNT